MKKITLPISLLSLVFFCIDSFALKATPALTLSWNSSSSTLNDYHSEFHAIVGYPSGKPAILVYSPNMYDPYTPSESESFAKLYITGSDEMNSQKIIKNEQFFDLKSDNITMQELRNALKERQDDTKKIVLNLQKISWVDSCKSFYALGSLSLLNMNLSLINLKPIILISIDGKNWSVDKDALNIISSKEITNFVIGNNKNYPILIALGDDGGIYYKELKPNGSWHISNTHTAPFIANYSDKDVFVDGSQSTLFTYQDNFLLLNAYTKTEGNTYKMKEAFLVGKINEKGLEWESLSNPSELFIYGEPILAEGAEKLMIRFAKIESTDAEGYSTLSEKSSDQGYAELGIDEATNRLALNNKIFDSTTSFTPDFFTSQENPESQKIKNALFLSKSSSSTEGIYYFIFSDPKDYFSSSYWTKVNSLQELAQPKLRHLELEDGHSIRLFGDFENPQFRTDFLSINNQTYLLGETLMNNQVQNAVIATFYRINE